MAMILGSLSSHAIRLRHRLLAPSSPMPAAPSTIVPKATMFPATAATLASRRNFCNNKDECKERYEQLTWTVLPVLGLLFFYSQHKQNKRINEMSESLAVLNYKDKEKEKKTCCCCCSEKKEKSFCSAPPATTSASSTATAATTSQP